MSFVQSMQDAANNFLALAKQSKPGIVAIIFLAFFMAIVAFIWFFVYLISPIPRKPRASEKQYITNQADGRPTAPRPQTCWHETWQARKLIEEKMVLLGRKKKEDEIPIMDAEVFMSVVVPAYNEQERINYMLEEAVAFLQRAYGVHKTKQQPPMNEHDNAASPQLPGWEILIVSDGSTDKTIETALAFAHKHRLPEGALRIIALEENRGKGGAVTHGMRHVRGQYAVFADADGASKFDDLASLVEVCQRIEDASGRAVAIGSRAHLVGSEAVVKRSLLRNTLMHAFHLLIRLMTPPATSRIKDTQCGFKLFSRPALPYIIPYMHSEGWIFDIEMLMLTEMAGIPMQEVAVGWREIPGSKLNVVWASLGMAWGLAQLRAAWGLGVYTKTLL
ncbi:hypothetical protein, variant [Verruconis gallopava]|uniref:dolichyl-phosphate beta-glucosyltransferase n=1 Tax=Verruconis gallopava TaxID=253628 RepID=A0A0D2ATI1_9PEZI|nr:hypothetical protein, variant [Verruconis gallopava]KIW02449.1 hypothetical protein, variant [Verruconis gallopava]